MEIYSEEYIKDYEKIKSKEDEDRLFKQARKRVQGKIKGRCATNKDVIVDQEKEIEYYRDKIQKLENAIHNRNGFSLSNVIELNKEDVLVFNAQFCINKKQMEYAQQDLEDRFGCKCIVLASGLELNKVITKENKKIDYVTDTTYTDGEVVKEIRTYYK